MKLITKLLAVAAFAFFGAFALTALNPTSAVAQDDQGQQAEEQPAEEQEQEVEGEFTYTAQPGDSYSLMARKAIQTFGFETETNLSEAEIIAAETFLTQEAGSPVLNLGQEVKISKASVDAAVEKAQALSDEAKALWAQYATFADFNTNDVGESR